MTLHPRRSRARFALRRTVAWPLALAIPMTSLNALAGGGVPTGGTVTAGKATIIAPTLNSVVVNQASQRGVVKWSDFSIGQGSQVTFVQPGTGSATLNIVSGPAISTIAGSLQSNGSVFLVNPSGITITPTGLVDTGAGFIASTLGISASDFMNGSLRFAGTGGEVVNQGRITAAEGGAVVLLGSQVRNDGVINAPLGRVGLGSAQSATLDLGGDGFLQILLPAGATTADGRALVDNGGVILADGGTVTLAAATVRDAVRNAINMPGEIRARSVSGHDGAIVLGGGDGGTVTITGILDASAGMGAVDGGRIDVSGSGIALQGATVAATGVDQGGLVRIGGAFQGGKVQDPASARSVQYIGRFGAVSPLANAARTDVDAGSSIDVSASGANGAGGTAIVWSDATTTMLGRVAATGAKSGGAVEISAAAQIQQIALAKVSVGAGGSLLLDPANIQITDGSSTGSTGDQPYGSNPGGTTQLVSSDILAQLDAGANVSLQASNDIAWNTFYSGVQPVGGLVMGGNLALSAGRSLLLSGAFTTAGGTWTLTANDTAAHGVISAERQAGSAMLDLGSAEFINSNGHLALSMLDGAGNTEHDADAIRVGVYSGESLTATVAPTATGPTPTRILLAGNLQASGSIVFTGNLQNTMGQETISGLHVTWTNESTGGTITGEGTLKFFENNVMTRFGTFSGVDAVRLGLGDSTTTGTRVYGDADPTFDDLGSAQLHVLPTSGNQPADALSGILAPGSLATSGPGVTAHVGTSTLTVGATSTIAAGGMLAGGYFIDLTPASLALTITPRTLTPTASNGGWVYGSPGAVSSLAGIVNGDSVAPVATLGGVAGTVMSANGPGYGFGQKTGAGTATYTLTGLAGSAASDYTLDLGGTISGTLVVSPKALTYSTGSGSQTYGTGGTAPQSTPTGLLAGDSVSHTDTYTLAGTSQVVGARMPAGTYDIAVTGLSGADAANYTISSTGNTDGVFVVNPKAITWSVANAASTYGTLATFGGVGFGGVLAGDDVSASVTATSGGMPFAIGATTHAGSYGEAVTGLAGAAAGNYVLAGSSNNAGTLTVAPKALTYSGSSVSAVYGSAALPTMTLAGIVGNDDVSGVAAVLGNATDVGGSGARPVGHYTTDLSGLAGANTADYTLASSGNGVGSLTITPRALTFTTGSATSVYGAVAGLDTPTLGGMLAGDAIVGTASLSAGGAAFAAADRTHAGSYTVGVQASDLAGAGASNYVVATSGNSAGTLVVSPRPITWQVAAGTATYGDAPSSAITFTGVLGGDGVGAQLTALDTQGAGVARPGVGSYQAGVASLTGTSASDYAIGPLGNTTGALTVTPRALTYAVANATATYGDLATLGAVTFSNLVQGDSVSAVEGASSFGNAVTLVPKLHAGSYDEVVTGVGNPNYVIAGSGNSTGVLTVAPRALTYATGSVTSIYGDAASTTATLAGVLPGDSVAAGAPLLQATGAAPTARQDVGTYALGLNSLAGADASNYRVTDTGSTFGALTITPRSVSYSLQGYFANTFFGALGGDTYQNASLAYGQVGGDLPVARATFSGLLPGDNLGMSTSGTPLTRSGGGYLNAGSYTFTGGALTGAKASDYVLAASGNTNATLTITPASVVMNLAATSNSHVFNQSVYGDSDGFTLAGSVGGVLKGDAVSVDGWLQLPGGNASSAPARLPVGTYAMDGALQGADAGNYVVSTKNIGAFTVNPRPVSIATGDTTSTYGDMPSLPTSTVGGVLSGESVSVATHAIEYGGSPLTLAPRTSAGTYTVVVDGLTGGDASNYTIVSNANVIGTDGLPPARAGSVIVAKRQLDYSVAPGSVFDLTYGQFLTPGSITGGVLPGDSVGLVENLLPISIHGVNTQGVGNYQIDWQLPVGSYAYAPQTTGAQGGDYFLGPQVFGTVNVAPKTVTATVAPISTTYGSYVAPGVTFDGLLGRDNYIPQLHVLGPSGETTYGQKSNAGSYLQVVTGFNSPAGTSAVNDGSLNYVFVPTPAATAPLVVTPKVLGFTPVTNATTNVYGNAAQLGALTGVLFGDDVGVQATGSGELGPRPFTSDASGNLSYAPRLDAGTYAWTGTLVGAKSGNYAVAPIATSVTIAPRPVTYTAENGSSTYGGYDSCSYSECYPWVAYSATNTFGGTFKGVLPGDAIYGNLGISDANGTLVSIDASTPVGNYLHVVTGLAGRSAGNYKLAPSGSTPGIWTVEPEWISYSTTSAIYLGQLVGTPGVPTLRGPDGPFGSGPDIHPVVTAVNPNGKVITDLSNLVVGRYTFLVTGLVGADADDFRLIPSGKGFTGAYASSDAGTLDVFSSASLGLAYGTANQQIPTIPPIPPAPVVTAPPLTGYAVGRNVPDTDFGRNIDATGTAGDTRITNHSVSASGTASGAVGTDTDVGGGVDLSTQASGQISGLAQFGIAGIKLEATADAHADVMLTSGPGFLEVGVQGDAYTIISIGRNGLQANSQATAGGYAQGGAEGEIGGVGDGSADATVGAYAYARSDEQVTYTDGHFQERFNEGVGVGVSAGGHVGLSGSNGSVDAGVTVYSPGSLAGTFSYSAGYSDGTVSMSLDLGASLGLGGLDLHINLSINVFNAASTVGGAFGIHDDYRPDLESYGDAQHAATITDPVARYNYLAGTPEFQTRPWDYTFNPDVAKAWDQQQAFLKSYTSLLSGTQALVAKQAADQATLLKLLATDPSAAIAMAHSGVLAMDQQAQASLAAQAQELGVQLAVTNGNLNYVTASSH